MSLRHRWLDLDEFLAISAAWDRLVSATCTRGLFMRSWFLEAGWRFPRLAGERKVFLVENDDFPVAGIPLARVPKGRYLPDRAIFPLCYPRGDMFCIPCLPDFEQELA